MQKRGIKKMQIVIDISEVEYGHIRNYYERNDVVEATYAHIYHGTVLPKHGRLIDADELKEQINTDIMGGMNYRWFIEHAPTILGAERGVNNDV